LRDVTIPYNSFSRRQPMWVSV